MTIKPKATAAFHSKQKIDLFVNIDLKDYHVTWVNSATSNRMNHIFDSSILTIFSPLVSDFNSNLKSIFIESQ